MLGAGCWVLVLVLVLVLCLGPFGARSADLGSLLADLGSLLGVSFGYGYKSQL